MPYDSDFEKLRTINFNDSKFDRIYESMDFLFTGENITTEELYKKLPIFIDVNEKMTRQTILDIEAFDIYNNGSFGQNFYTGELKLAQLKISNFKEELDFFNGPVRTRKK